MQFTTWKSATITHSVPERGWGIAQTLETKEPIFLHIARAMVLMLRGATLSFVRGVPQTVSIPPAGTDIIVFGDLILAECGGKYPQAQAWMPQAYFEEMEKSRAKAASTLAELAAKTAACEAARQADMAKIATRRSGSGGEKGKKKQHANA